MKKRISLMLAMILALSLAACAEGDSGGGGSAAPGSGKDIANDPIKIAYVAAQMDLTPVYWNQGIENVLNQYDNITYQLFDCNSSAETQSQVFNELILQEYDAILCHAVDSATLAASAKEAEEAGINVISLNLSPETVHSAYVSMVNYEGDKIVAEQVAEALGGTGNCVVIGPPVSVATVVKSATAFEETMEPHGGIQILEQQAGDWTTENANGIMRDFLSKYDNIDAVFCSNDSMAIGAAQAIEAAGKTGDILVWGLDGEPTALEYIRDGKMTGTVWTDTVQMGATGARLALYCIQTGISGAQLDSTPVIMIDPTVITAENVAGYIK